MKSSLAAVEARDPQTSVQRLYEIAASSPELHADLLLNPACTESLRSWILQAGLQTRQVMDQAPAPASQQAARSAGGNADPVVNNLPLATVTDNAVPFGTAPLQQPAPSAGTGPSATLELPAPPAPLVPAEGTTSEHTPRALHSPTSPAPSAVPLLLVPGASPAGPGTGVPPGGAASGDGRGAGPARRDVRWDQPALPPGLTPQRAAWLAGAALLVLVLALGARPLVEALGGSTRSSGSSTADGASAASGADQAAAGPSPRVTALAPSATPSRKYSGTKQRPAPADALLARLIDTQTQNIYCQISEERAACSIRERYYAAAGAQDCSGALFSISVGDGAPHLVCGESFLAAAGQSPQRLAPKQYAASGNFACLVEISGVSCWNQWTGHGFKLAREGYQTF